MPKDSLEQLAHASYWDRRYRTNDGGDALDTDGTGAYDWFKSFQAIRPFLERHLPGVDSAPKILHLGCGNSVSTCRVPIQILGESLVGYRCSDGT